MERQEYPLFPLILGLCLASAGAFGWYLVVGARHAPSGPSVATALPSAPKSPETAAPPAPAAPSAPVLASTPSDSSSPIPPAPSGEAATKIWQCDVNGQRVFTDFKCASDAKPTELPSVNRMNAVPVPPRRYPVYAAVPPANPEPEYYGGDELASTPVYAPYPVVYTVRPRPMHPRRPPHSSPHHGER